MGRIQGKGTLFVGVPGDLRPFGFMPKKGGRPQGFLVGVGRDLASALGVRARFITTPARDLVRLLDSGLIDIAFPPLALTEERLREHRISDPYFVGHQRLLVPADSALSGVEHLAKKRVCAFIDGRTGVALDRLNPDVEVVKASSLRRCLRLLRADEVDAVTASDLFLVALLARLSEGRDAKRPRAGGPAANEFEIVGDQLTTEGYAGMIAPNIRGFAPFVNSVLKQAEDEGRWEKWRQRWIAPLTEEVVGPPELSAQQAAALYPFRGSG